MGHGIPLIFKDQPRDYAVSPFVDTSGKNIKTDARLKSVPETEGRTSVIKSGNYYCHETGTLTHALATLVFHEITFLKYVCPHELVHRGGRGM